MAIDKMSKIDRMSSPKTFCTSVQMSLKINYIIYIMKNKKQNLNRRLHAIPKEDNMQHSIGALVRIFHAPTGDEWTGILIDVTVPWTSNNGVASIDVLVDDVFCFSLCI